MTLRLYWWKAWPHVPGARTWCHTDKHATQPTKGRRSSIPSSTA